MNKIALITGASSGIGESTAFNLAQEGYSLVLAGRREVKLKDFAKSIQDLYKVEAMALPLDVTDRNQTFKAIKGLSGSWRKVELLVISAGLAAGFDSFDLGSFSDWDKMIDTNMRGLLNVSRAYLLR